MGFIQKQVYVGVNENISNQDAKNYAEQILDRAAKKLLSQIKLEENNQDNAIVLYS